jgi:DNA-binding NarL/FixJ family response regulator
VLDALPQRARLVDEHGRKIHGNALDELPDDETSPPHTTVSLLVEERPHAVELRAASLVRSAPLVVEPIGESMLAVAEAWAHGRDVHTIAGQTGLTVASVRTYVKRVYRKLGVSSRPQLVAALLGSAELSASPRPSPLAARCSGDE